VKYTSRREAQTKAAHAQARAASAQAKAAREEAKLLRSQRRTEEAELAQDKPATAPPTIRRMVQERLAKRAAAADQGSS